MPGQFVIDNSVVMAWCFTDEGSAYADAVLDTLVDTTVCVPYIWPLEVGNVLLVAERKKRLSEADSTRFIALLNELPIVIEPEGSERMLGEIMVLARAHSLSTYDATYLDLAMRQGLPIATLDRNLRAAAGHCRIPIFLGDSF